MEFCANVTGDLCGPSVWYFVDLGYGGMCCLPCPHGARGLHPRASERFIDNQRKRKNLRTDKRSGLAARQRALLGLGSLEEARKTIQVQ